MWRLRYVFGFQAPRVAEWRTRRKDFADVDALWRHGAAPDWTPPPEHLAQVKQTLRASWPAPLRHYRSGGLGLDGKPWPPLATPTLYLAGEQDGCVSPAMAKGQEAFFAGPFQNEVVPGARHFLHREQPEAVGERILAWLQPPTTA